MDQENKWLFVVAGVLIASALVTAGLVILLNQTTPDEGNQTALPAEGPPVAFVSDLEGTAAIHVMAPSGSNRRTISNPDLGVCLYPAWSPDGQRVAYWGAEGDSFWGNSAVPGVWVSTANGSEHVRVSPDAAVVSTVIPPVWSPDGTKLAFVASNGPDGAGETADAIHIAWADGSGVEQTIPLPWEAQYLAWSPSGDDLLLVSKTADAGSAYRWSSQEEALIEISANVEAADWSPDGGEVVVGSTADGSVSILGQNGELHPVAEFGAGLPLAIAWSPDGARVAVGTNYSRVRGRSFGFYISTSLHVVTLESGEVTTVVEQAGLIHHLDWSRDGSRLSFTLVTPRVRPDSVVPYANLWAYDVASSQLKQLTDEPGFAGAAAWSP